MLWTLKCTLNCTLFWKQLDAQMHHRSNLLTYLWKMCPHGSLRADSIFSQQMAQSSLWRCSSSADAIENLINTRAHIMTSTMSRENCRRTDQGKDNINGWFSLAGSSVLSFLQCMSEWVGSFLMAHQHIIGYSVPESRVNVKSCRHKQLIKRET